MPNSALLRPNARLGRLSVLSEILPRGTRPEAAPPQFRPMMVRERPFDPTLFFGSKRHRSRPRGCYRVLGFSSRAATYTLRHHYCRYLPLIECRHCTSFTACDRPLHNITDARSRMG